MKRVYLVTGVAVIAALVAGYALLNNRNSGLRIEPQPLSEQAGVKPQPDAVEQDETSTLTQLNTPFSRPELPAALPIGGSDLASIVKKTEQDFVTPMSVSEVRYSPFGFACERRLSATKAAGAMVMLAFDAPCQVAETVTVRHKGLEFTMLTSGIGRFSVVVPAFAKQAVFEVEMPDGEVVSASIFVSEADDFDRVAVQWAGDSILKIHAFEPSVGLRHRGHVWANAPQSVLVAVQARGGYITELGGVDTTYAIHAEVYSFPTRRVQKPGVVRLSIQAEVTNRNCGKDIQAKTLQSGVNGGVSMVDLTVSMPSCDAIGDFLVLNNLLRDLKIAQN